MSNNLFKNLIPIIRVKELEAEKTFYLNLGFSLSYEGDEFPGFIGLKYGDIEFGVEKSSEFDSTQANKAYYVAF